MNMILFYELQSRVTHEALDYLVERYPESDAEAILKSWRVHLTVPQEAGEVVELPSGYYLVRTL